MVSDFCHLSVSGDAVNGGTGHADTLWGEMEEVVEEEGVEEVVEKEEVEDRGGTPRAAAMEERI